MSNTASNFLTIPFPQEEEIYGVITTTTATGEIQSGFRATVRVSQSVKASIGSSISETSSVPSQSIKGEIGSQVEGLTHVTHQIAKGEIGSGEEAISNSEGQVTTFGSSHISLSAKVVTSTRVSGLIGDSFTQSEIVNSSVSGEIGTLLHETATAADLVSGSIGVAITERHYKPTNRNITLKVL